MVETSRMFERAVQVLSRLLILAVASTLLGLAAPGVAADDVRTWKDASGKFAIKAKFVSVADGVVTLLDQSGEKVEVELDQLAEADKTYVAQRQKEAASPFRKKAADVPSRKTPAEPGAASGTKIVGESKDVEPDWSNVRTLAATPANLEWKITVGASADTAPAAKAKPVPLPHKTSFFEGAKALVVNGPGTRAVVGYVARDPGKDPTSRVVLCDLEGGRTLGAGGAPGAYVPLAVSDAGDRVVIRTDGFGPGKHDRLELWSVSKSGIARGNAWSPYAAASGGNGGDRDVRWAAFLDAKRLATVSEGGMLIVWKMDPVEPLFTLQLQGGCTPGLSPDRKLMAFTTGKEIGVLDTAEGEVLAIQPAPAPNMAWTSFAFSPSGKRLACQVFIGKVFVYTVADGSKGVEVPLMGLNAQQPTLWTDESHILIGGTTLVDLESQVRLWQYQGGDQVANARGMSWFHVAPGERQTGALIPARLPQPGVQESLAKALKDPAFFIVKPGTSVSIDATGITDASRREDVVRMLLENLAKDDVRAAPGSAVTVEVSVTQGAEEEISYRTMGGGFRVDHFKIRPQIGRVRYLYQGKVAWETGSSTVPFFDIAHLKKDESLQDHVRKFEKPNYEFFKHVELPKLLTRPTGQPTLGTSQVTMSGVR